MADTLVDDRVDVTGLDGIVRSNHVDTIVHTIAPDGCVNMHVVRKPAVKPACEHTAGSPYTITS